MPHETTPSKALLVEEELWKPRENEKGDKWGEFRSLWKVTDAPDGTHLRQTAGINPIAQLRSGEGKGRTPGLAIFLSASGERQALPWLDDVDLDNGFIRYFGDNKPGQQATAEEAPGNRHLLAQMELYSSTSIADRQRAAPLLFFRNLGASEGQPLTQFLGYGIIRTAHRVTQLYKRKTFSNYAYDCILLQGDETKAGTEYLDMSWVDLRRDPTLSDEQANSGAPRAWRQWIKEGATCLDSRRVRRYVDRAHRWSADDQLPQQQSALGRSLQAIYDRYSANNDQHGFQALAALASEHVLSEQGLSFERGWVTPVGPDGGVDFVQRLDVGHGMAHVPLVVLGQAKCKKPWSSSSGVNAEDLARVVARLRRGWIGCYVTTSRYTDVAQRELIVDEYPIALIAGRQLAEAAESIRDEQGLASIEELLDWVDEEYHLLRRAARANPGDIVKEWPGLSQAIH